MSVAAILAIVVATGEAQDPATAIMLGAAAESLGPEISVRLIDASEPGSVDPLRIERELGAGAVVTLVWRDAARLRARIRLHVAAGGRSTTRDLVFSAADTRAERGRTLGLAAASMWPEILSAGRASPSPRGPPAVALLEHPAPASRQESDPKAQPVSDAKLDLAERARRQDHPVSPEAIDRARRPAPGPREAGDGAALRASRVEIGIAAIGATGIGGRAGGLGARLEGLLHVRSNWWVRMALGVRSGSIPELPGSDLASALSGGVEWWPAIGTFGRVASLGMRADALALRHQVRGSVIAGRTEDQGRFLPGLDLLAQALLSVGARIELLVAAGSEAALGRTQIRSGGPTPVTVATIPVVRLTAEIGMRVRF